jgi:hypothetical protein
VIVNGRRMDAAQLVAFHARYGAYPGAGAWWYDTTSGLYGQQGGPALSFLHAGHDFGPLDPNASRGNTGVFINGRQLPQIEVQTWMQLVGGVVLPGRYWLDHQGSFGYEGHPIPLDNLYLIAQRRSAMYGGAASVGGGGDNGWNTRFSSGNSNADNSAGYVHVPGAGVIGSYGVD